MPVREVAVAPDNTPEAVAKMLFQSTPISELSLSTTSIASTMTRPRGGALAGFLRPLLICWLLPPRSPGAALAGVVWLPDISSAITYAKEAATKNGYTNGVAGVTVTVAQVGDRRLRVTITDPNVGSFFYKNLGGRNITLTRKGTAEYILPVPVPGMKAH